MARQQVNMIEFRCGAPTCTTRRAAPADYDGPPGWYVGEIARVDENGHAELVEVEACQPRHIRGAVEAVTGANGGGDDGSAADVADDPVDNAADGEDDGEGLDEDDVDDLDADDAEDDDGEGLDEDEDDDEDDEPGTGSVAARR